MTPERWQQVKAALAVALELDPTNRAAYLDQVCADDPSLREELDRLLVADEMAGAAFLARPATPPGLSEDAREPDLWIGRRVGAYEIVAPLGAGGMGAVYRARDTRLKRDVAIKVLPESLATDPDRLARFQREAELLATLNHPNIGAVYGLEESGGTTAIVMELVEGQTLAARLMHGALPIADALSIARQIVDALDAAQEQGIVHRDLKPANINITPRGVAKVLDFGLAKAVTADGSRLEVMHSLTSTDGVVLGTAAYMSPEQARGQPVDKQTDIWAFGCVLYEMLTGRSAFAGNTAIDTIAAILEREPDCNALPADLPASVERLIHRCLEKERDQRISDIAELRAGLDDLAAGTAQTPERFSVRWPYVLSPLRHSRLPGTLSAIIVGALAILITARAGLLHRWFPQGGTGRITSLAVLPLKNLSDDPQQAFFVDGMTEALTSSLAQVHSLKVIARTSSEQYKESKKPLREIARDLGVDSVLEGSVVRAGNRIRVAARLIQAENQTQLWAKSFERDLGDVLALQSEIAGAITRQIEAKLTTDEQNRLATMRPIDPKAYEAYLLGRFSLDQGTEESLKSALEQFTKALQIQPDYAAAHAALASYYAILPFYSSLSPAEVFPKARAEAEKSLEIDESLAEAHASLAYIRAYYEWDWQTAEHEFRRALELRPSYADAHLSFSRFLAAAGRMDEAVAEIRRAQQLDPRSVPLKVNTALLFYFSGRYDEALDQLFEVQKLDPNLPVALWGIGLTYEQKGQQEQAIEALRRAASLSKSLDLQSSLGHAYALFGKRAEAEAILSMLRERSRTSYVPSYFSALIYVGLGDKDHAFEWLERAFQERSTVLAYLRLDPRLTPLRSDPRFAELLRRIGRA